VSGADTPTPTLNRFGVTDTEATASRSGSSASFVHDKALVNRTKARRARQRRPWAARCGSEIMNGYAIA